MSWIISHAISAVKSETPQLQPVLLQRSHCGAVHAAHRLRLHASGRDRSHRPRRVLSARVAKAWDSPQTDRHQTDRLCARRKLLVRTAAALGLPSRKSLRAQAIIATANPSSRGVVIADAQIAD